MLESDYILVQKLTNIRIARNIVADCAMEPISRLKRVLILLDEVIEECKDEVELCSDEIS